MEKEFTTKDLMALNELLTFENWMAVKMKACAECVKAATLKTMFSEMAQKHLDNHSKLLNQLEKNGEQGGKQ